MKLIFPRSKHRLQVIISITTTNQNTGHYKINKTIWIRCLSQQPFEEKILKQRGCPRLGEKDFPILHQQISNQGRKYSKWYINYNDQFNFKCWLYNQRCAWTLEYGLWSQDKKLQTRLKLIKSKHTRMDIYSMRTTYYDFKPWIKLISRDQRKLTK